MARNRRRTVLIRLFWNQPPNAGGASKNGRRFVTLSKVEYHIGSNIILPVILDQYIESFERFVQCMQCILCTVVVSDSLQILKFRETDSKVYRLIFGFQKKLKIELQDRVYPGQIVLDPQCGFHTEKFNQTISNIGIIQNDAGFFFFI